MANSEIYDFVSTVTADVDQTLTLKAQGTLLEDGFKNQMIHLADDNTEERITLTTGSLFYVVFNLNMLDEADAGTIFDLYHDSAKANGMGNSFKWLSPDGHTYVVRFDGKLPRTRQRAWNGVSEVRLRVLGRIADA